MFLCYNHVRGGKGRPIYETLGCVVFSLYNIYSKKIFRKLFKKGLQFSFCFDIIVLSMRGSEKMIIEVKYSYTIDFVEWDCPKCGCHNEYYLNDSEDDQRCQGCDFEIKDYYSRLGESNGDIDTYEIEN